jgi:hypothetical protein
VDNGRAVVDITAMSQDTATAGDFITTDTTLTYSGTVTPKAGTVITPEAQVKLDLFSSTGALITSALVPITTTNGTSTWSWPYETNQAVGNYTLKATVVDQSGVRFTSDPVALGDDPGTDEQAIVVVAADAAPPASNTTALSINPIATDNLLSTSEGASTNTTGTNTLLTLSAKRCTGAFVAWASRTNLAMRANVVSAPTRVARTTRRPCWFTVAEVTASPTCTSTGTLSPVIIDISTDDDPSSTTPSAAIFSPGRTTTRSPSRITDAGMDISTPSRNTFAYLAPNAINERNASPAEFFARISK